MLVAPMLLALPIDLSIPLLHDLTLSFITPLFNKNWLPLTLLNNSLALFIDLIKGFETDGWNLEGTVGYFRKTLWGATSEELDSEIVKFFFSVIGRDLWICFRLINRGSSMDG